MKNFYEATVIKPTLGLSVSLILEPVGQLPCLVQINRKTIFENTISVKTKIVYQLPLEEPIDISIKIDRQHPDAIIVFLNIDNNEILPKYLCLADPPTNYLDQSGIWSFKIPSFYPWLHHITGQGWIV
jgi:hypothetical protein